MSSLIKGWVVGFLIAAPVGPIGILCITRALRGGWLAGFVTGLGAATADAFYGAVAAFGVTAVTATLTQFSRPLHLVGAVFLCYLGLRIALAAPKPAAQTSGGGGPYAAAYLSTVMLTAMNPATIFSFIAVFATIAPAGRALSAVEASSSVMGVFLGSAAWWLLLALGVARGRHVLTPRVQRLIGAASGAALIAFGVSGLWFVRTA